MTVRTARVERDTKETRIRAELTVDGAGRADVTLPQLPFLEHMLTAMTKYSGMDLSLHGEGDVEVDAHHLVEDCGLVVGTALSRALGDRAGIRRFGEAHAPLDESLVRCVLDLSNRPFCVYEMGPLHDQGRRINDFDVSLLGEWVRAFTQTGGISLHLDMLRGENLHHIAEAGFKSLGLALRSAVTVIGVGVPSTKGVL